MIFEGKNSTCIPSDCSWIGADGVDIKTVIFEGKNSTYIPSDRSCIGADGVDAAVRTEAISLQSPKPAVLPA